MLDQSILDVTFFFPWDFILIFLQIQNVAEQFSNHYL